MRYFVLLLTLASILGASAQTGLVEFPYNPDADGNDFIGTADLMELLAVFGEEFSEEGLYLNDDSTSALYFAGYTNRGMCLASCSDLPGKWKMIDINDWAEFNNEVEAASPSDMPIFTWLDSDRYHQGGADGWLVVSHNELGGWPKGTFSYVALWDEGPLACFCSTHERPKVEYTYVRGSMTGGNPAYFQILVDSKVQDGWYPLGGIQIDSYDASQSFWRWAE